MAAANAHTELAGAVYTDPWSGWWGGASKVNFQTGVGSVPVYNGVAAGRLDAASDVSGYFTSIDTNPGSPNYGGWLNLTIDGEWHGGWNDGAVNGIFLHGIDSLAPNSTQFTTFITAHAPQTPNPAVQAVSIVVGIGVGILTAEFGPIVAGAAGMAAANATGGC